jgi:hypothetical protein
MLLQHVFLLEKWSSDRVVLNALQQRRNAKLVRLNVESGAMRQGRSAQQRAGCAGSTTKINGMQAPP